MSKIKLNLVSGVSVEKPLINAFKANNASYVILDNEMNGSMGLPIILVCKMVDNKLVKIIDPSEWTNVKESLKQIIAGNGLENFAVPNELSADDIYYTQLTLPVPSFDALKNAYTIASPVEEDPMVGIMDPVMDSQTSVMEPTQVAPAAPVMPEISVSPVAPVAPVMPEIPVAPVQPVMPEVTPVSPVVEPVAPIEPIMPTMPTFEMPSAPISPDPTNVVMPSVDPTPISVEMQVAPVVEENIFASQKEAFMEACENMFDALVQKFEKELQNKQN